MTVKIRHRVHLSLKKMKNTMENVFFGGKGTLFYDTEMHKIELLQLFTKAKQFY